jgi:hypothetical protein
VAELEPRQQRLRLIIVCFSRWNKLEMLTYQSINLFNGEALGLSLKHQKPFYFSK